MTICILLGAGLLLGRRRHGFLLLSGVAAGLAFLSKAPSAFLPLFVPLHRARRAGERRRSCATARPGCALVRDGLIWGVLALVVAMVLWPSFRADPIGTLFQMVDYTETVGGSDHENFFMGQPVGDPGPALLRRGAGLPPDARPRCSGWCCCAVGLLPIRPAPRRRAGGPVRRAAGDLLRPLHPDDVAAAEEVRPLPAADLPDRGDPGRGRVLAAAAAPAARLGSKTLPAAAGGARASRRRR